MEKSKVQATAQILGRSVVNVFCNKYAGALCATSPRSHAPSRLHVSAQSTQPCDCATAVSDRVDAQNVGVLTGPRHSSVQCSLE